MLIVNIRPKNLRCINIFEKIIFCTRKYFYNSRRHTPQKYVHRECLQVRGQSAKVVAVQQWAHQTAGVATDTIREQTFRPSNKWPDRQRVNLF